MFRLNVRGGRLGASVERYQSLGGSLDISVRFIVDKRKHKVGHRSIHVIGLAFVTCDINLAHELGLVTLSM